MPVFTMEDISQSRLIIKGEFTISDILGAAYSSHSLNAIEHELLNNIIFPTVPHRYDKMAEILRGAHVIVHDDGEIYKSISRLFGVLHKKRPFYAKTPDLKFKLPTLGILLSGLKSSGSWFRLEAPQLSQLKNDFLELPRYLLTGKRSNTGPFGVSQHTEYYEPLEINNTDDESFLDINIRADSLSEEEYSFSQD